MSSGFSRRQQLRIHSMYVSMRNHSTNERATVFFQLLLNRRLHMHIRDESTTGAYDTLYYIYLHVTMPLFFSLFVCLVCSKHLSKYIVRCSRVCLSAWLALTRRANSSSRQLADKWNGDDQVPTAATWMLPDDDSWHRRGTVCQCGGVHHVRSIKHQPPRLNRAAGCDKSCRDNRYKAVTFLTNK